MASLNDRALGRQCMALMTQVLCMQGGGTQPTEPGFGPSQDRQPIGFGWLLQC
jgi:hypothetical protein